LILLCKSNIIGVFAVNNEKKKSNDNLFALLQNLLPKELLMEALQMAFNEQATKQERIEHLSQEIQTLQKVVEVEKVENETIKKKNQSLQEEILQAKRQIASLAQRLDAITKTLEKMGKKIGDLEKEVPETKQEEALVLWVNLFKTASSAKLVHCPKGHFLMGADTTDKEAFLDERPVKSVSIMHEFLLWSTPVTMGQFSEMMGYAPYSATPLHPITGVTWHEAAAFCNALSVKQGLPEIYQIVRENGRFVASIRAAYLNEFYCHRVGGWRLPTEAEWEYAARAGTTTPRYGDVNDIAWFDEDAKAPQEVAEKAPNAWGCHDMLGNVWEWCANVWTPSPSNQYPSSLNQSKTDERYVIRGACYKSSKREIRVSTRDSLRGTGDLLSVGFRPCRTWRGV
jgi:formylglycine-generating enzyme required for sulfatase activity